MKKATRKGFTIVELLVVIAVIAVLAAVLIPVMVYLIDDAKTSADEQMTASLNKAIAAETGNIDTMSDALEVAEEYGYGVEKLTPTSEGNLIVWDSQTKYFALVTEEGEEVYANGDLSDTEYLFTIISDESEIVTSDTAEADSGAETYAARTIVAKAATAPVFSYYLGGGFTYTSDALTVSAGIDVGEHEDVSVKLSTGDTLSGGLIVNTAGGAVEIAASNATVKTYGTADSVTVSGGTVNVYGEVVGNLEVSGGTVTTQASASVGLVYVTGSSAVVTATSGSIGAVASTVGDDNITASEVVSLTDEDVANMAYFAGGIGTEGSPYQIATADQFANIGNIDAVQINGRSNILSGVDDGTGTYTEIGTYFELTDSISLSHESGVAVTYFTAASLNGNGNTIYASSDIFGGTAIAEISNVNIDFNGTDCNVVAGYESTAGYLGAYDTTFSYVSLSGDVDYTSRNQGLFVGYAGMGYGNYDGYGLVFNYCSSGVDLCSVGGDTDYNAVFAGYAYGKLDMEFNGCVNTGTFISGQAAFFLGNDPSTNEVSISANGCSNAGSIISTNSLSSSSQYVGVGSSKVTVTIDGTTLFASSGTYAGVYTGFSEAAANGLALALNDDGTFTVTASTLSSVSYYMISYSGHFSFYKEEYGVTGSDKMYITETISADSFTDGTYTSEIEYLGFAVASEDSYSDSKTIGSYTAVYIDGVWYYLVENETFSTASWIVTDEDGNTSYERTEGTVSAPTTVSVMGYDEDGTIVAVYVLTVS